MFDISFAELMIISIVALIVVGPERLPMVARTLGHFLGRARRYVERIKHDLHEEIELENFRKLKESMQDTVHTFEDSVHKEIKQAQKSIDHQSNKVTEEKVPCVETNKEAISSAHDRSVNPSSQIDDTKTKISSGNDQPNKS